MIYLSLVSILKFISLVDKNKSIIEFAHKPNSKDSYTLQQFLRQVKEKCDNLIEFDDYLFVKEQRLMKFAQTCNNWIYNFSI